jgi:membrane fusion protein (multidrug efflux system)
MSAAVLKAVEAPLGALDAGPQVKMRARLPVRPLLVLAAALVVGAGGVIWLRSAGGSVATDNAYVKADVTVVAPRVKGLVAQVLVAENQSVQAGQPLVRLDPEEYAARVAGAQSDLALADAAVAAAEGAIGRLSAERALAASHVREASTDIAASDAEAARAQADWKRYETLAASGTVPRRDAERIHAEAISAAAAAAKTRATLATSRDEAVVTDRRGAELAAALAQARAQRAKAQADLALARQDEGHALIRAPISGVVGDRQANPGDYVQPGSRLLTLVPQNAVYLTANFKETQTAKMLAGQTATVQVDALPGVKLKAHVESFSPASSSEFALLPFEPGVGNFTKIVQRVPVRLKFDPGQPELKRLRPGLSAKVKVALD